MAVDCPLANSERCDRTGCCGCELGNCGEQFPEGFPEACQKREETNVTPVTLSYSFISQNYLYPLTFGIDATPLEKKASFGQCYIQ